MSITESFNSIISYAQDCIAKVSPQISQLWRERKVQIIYVAAGLGSLPVLYLVISRVIKAFQKKPSTPPPPSPQGSKPTTSSSASPKKPLPTTPAAPPAVPPSSKNPTAGPPSRPPPAGLPEGFDPASVPLRHVVSPRAEKSNSEPAGAATTASTAAVAAAVLHPAGQQAPAATPRVVITPTGHPVVNFDPSAALGKLKKAPPLPGKQGPSKPATDAANDASTGGVRHQRALFEALAKKPGVSEKPVVSEAKKESTGTAVPSNTLANKRRTITLSPKEIQESHAEMSAPVPETSAHKKPSFEASPVSVPTVTSPREISAIETTSQAVKSSHPAFLTRFMKNLFSMAWMDFINIDGWQEQEESPTGWVKRVAKAKNAIVHLVMVDSFYSDLRLRDKPHFEKQWQGLRKAFDDVYTSHEEKLKNRFLELKSYVKVLIELDQARNQYLESNDIPNQAINEIDIGQMEAFSWDSRLNDPDFEERNVVKMVFWFLEGQIEWIQDVLQTKLKPSSQEKWKSCLKQLQALQGNLVNEAKHACLDFKKLKQALQKLDEERKQHLTGELRQYLGKKLSALQIESIDGFFNYLDPAGELELKSFFLKSGMKLDEIKALLPPGLIDCQGYMKRLLQLNACLNFSSLEGEVSQIQEALTSESRSKKFWAEIEKTDIPEEAKKLILELLFQPTEENLKSLEEMFKNLMKLPLLKHYMQQKK